MNFPTAFGGADESDNGRQQIGDQARVLMTHFIRDRIQQDGIGDQLREEDLYEPGTPQGDRKCVHILEFIFAVTAVGRFRCTTTTTELLYSME